MNTRTLRRIAAHIHQSYKELPNQVRGPLAMVVASTLAFTLALGSVVAGDPSSAADGAARSPAETTAAAGDAGEAPAGETGADEAGAQAAAGLKSSASERADAPVPQTEVIGFYVNWNETSYNSLAANIDQITVLMPEWYHVDTKGNVYQNNAEKQAKAMKLIEDKNPDMKVMPMVTNFGPGGEDPKAIARVLGKASGRKKMAKQITSMAVKGGFDGVNIDFEGLPESSRGDLVAFMRDFYREAKPHGLTISQDVIVGSKTYNHSKLAQYVDYLIPMMYDEHWKTSPSGPIASQGWYEKTLAKFLDQVPPEKTVVALGAWTYDWKSGASRAGALTYPEAVARARRNDAVIKTEKTSLNPTFGYERKGAKHRLWILDATTMFNQIKGAEDHGVRGYAIWRLGAEDPAMWKVLPHRDALDAAVAESLETPNRSIAYSEERERIVYQRLAP